MHGPSDTDVSAVAASDEPWTVKRILLWSTNYLREIGIETARLDAECLLADVLGCTRVQLYVQFDKPLSIDERNRFRGLLRRRALHEPVAYLLGSRDFFGRSFLVSPAVLIPRSDTECLIETCLNLYTDRDAAISILDVGSGSGCIGVTLAAEYPASRVTCIDVSLEALVCARKNAERLAVMDRVTFRQLSMLDESFLTCGGRFDLVVSNPPYIPSSDIQGLMQDVRGFEPHLALDGGPDGLICYRALAQSASSLLQSGGWLVVEVGVNQERDVQAILSSAGAHSLSISADYGGIPRVVAGAFDGAEFTLCRP